MELKVWVEGIQRIVCGVTDVTTCQDVVYALAHATGKTGRFTLMERWRNSERLLAPHEHPLKILLKWGEYASDVQFILQRTAFEPKSESGRLEAKVPPVGQQRPPPSPAQGQQQMVSGGGGTSHPPLLAQQQQRLTQKVVGGGTPQSPLQSRDIKKSLTFSGGHSSLPSSTPTPVPEGLYPEVGAPTVPQGYIPKLSPQTHLPTQTPQQSDTSGDFPLHHSRHHHFPPSNSSSSSSGGRPPHLPFSINRPPAPPPYELVRGHPPPPPSGSSARHPFHHSTSAFGSYPSKKDWRNPPPPPTSGIVRPPPPINSSLFRARPPPRELPPPPYRDPPPPPPPSHPALVKISPPKGSGRGGSPHLPLPSPTSNSEESQPPLLTSDHERKFQGENSSNSSSSTPKLNDSRDRDDLAALESNKNVERSALPASVGSTASKDEGFGKFNSQKHSRVLDKVKKETRNANFTEEKNHSEIPVVPSTFDSSKSGRGTDSPSNSPIKTFPIGNRNLEENHSIQNDSSTTTDLNENEALTPSVKKSPVVNKNQTKDGFLNSGELGGEKSMVQSIIKQLVKNSAKEINSSAGYNNNNLNPSTEEVVVDGYYRELVKLVNQQREKISAQQIDLTKYEAEIAFTEGRWKEEESRLSYLREEIQKLEKAPDKQVDLKQLSQLEEQLKTAKKMEASAEEDISSIQKKINSCNEKLAEMNERVRSIEETLRQEEQAQQQKMQETMQEEEQEAMLREIEKLHLAVEQATEQANLTQGISQQLAQEMQEAESRLEEKRREIEALKQAMRDANLEALSMTPPDEAKTLSESRAGSAKAGTNRRMVGSPRQLETAVPTSKNPHGVWV